MGTFYGFWQCKYCGRENSGKDLSCGGCGHSRDKDTKFYPTSRGDKKPKEYIENYVNKGPDWLCSYCDSLNRADVSSCRNCGHTREESDKHYFELHPERVAVRKNLEDFDRDADVPSRRETRESYESEPREKRKVTYSSVDSDRSPRTISDFVGSSALDLVSPGFLKYILLGMFAVVLFVCLVIALMPKERNLTITDKVWERSVIVEEYRTVRESDWIVPAGGRMVGSHQEIHHYDSVLDHYQTVTKTRTVADGGHYETTGYRDNGDGTFTEIQTYVTDYRTETYTEQEPVYISVPVYQTKYDYDIERWKFDHNETSSGHTDEPYFTEPILEENFRTNGTDEKYEIVAEYVEKDEVKTETFKVSFDEWKSLSVGDEIRAKVYAGNRLEIIFEE